MMMGEAVSLAFEDDLEAAARERAAEVHDRASEIADEHGAEVDTVVDLGRPAHAIVLGSHGGTVVDRLFVGNVARTVFRHAPVPVTVVR